MNATTITILPQDPGSADSSYCAVAGKLHFVGATVGEALDGLASQLDKTSGTTLVVVQHGRPDALFTAEQHRRMEELMQRWRAARDGGTVLPPHDQAELEALVASEVRAATHRAAALVRGMGA